MAKQEEKSDLLEFAKLAERSERYEDMSKYMEKVTEQTTKGSSLHPEERNLLSVAFKNVVGARRSSWRVISSLQQKEEFGGDKKDLLDKYRMKVENELKDICNRVLVRKIK